jgi:hypothetical protein
MKRDGPLPKAPSKKPPAEEREPVLNALRIIPVGENMSIRQWVTKWSTPYLRIKFELWGTTIAIYPAARTEVNESKTCTGVFIMGLAKTKRGVLPKISLHGKFDTRWYRQILEWLDESYYGG